MFLVAACTADVARKPAVAEFDTSSAPEDTASASGPTWYGDVAPIVERNCLECHRTGGSAPVSLDSYASAAAWASAMATATATRRMPPWMVDSSGDCGTWKDARGLTDAEIAVIGAWADAGAPSGEGEEPIPPPPETLPEIDVSVDIGGDYTPDPTLVDDYRCYVLELPAKGPQYLAGYHTAPGNLAVVHHATLYAPLNAEVADKARALDAADTGPGWACQKSIGASPFDVIALWNVGTPATPFPEGTGIPIDTDLPILVREHYVPDGSDDPDRTTFHFDFEETVEIPSRYVSFSNEEVSLPPGEALLSSSADFVAGDEGFTQPLTLWGAAPHMHALGRTIEITRNPDTAPECLVRSLDWNYHWQQTFFYRETLALQPEDVVRVACTWDTQESDTLVEFGQGSEDEMCLVAFYANEPVTDTP